ncbi:cellulase family glycosylhydrolase [Paractinoplanes atraurantiacus]|uniref:Cellulase (Glycosyl hydrolase family 5) n=1 Tax=Paractinoplanes atraurantiacus TaxID=1036182 RepID=A0A285J2F4_9ACTN|nr:cellulase family glycosylhydrolase [Actinoplanes atraurantiacus]SNY53546.1 Cellulase (glycosyl hydrolase family 5) [Actinoplanes atraurantiacus]
MRKAAALALGLATSLLAASPLTEGASAAKQATPTLAGRIAAAKTAKQINYYPSANGWSRMWTSFDPVTIGADLAKARALGADSVRVIVFPTVFGYPTPKPEYAAKLAKFVELAGRNGMTVKLTLFDWWDGYADVKGSSTWATALLKPYRNDKRVISIGLKNELDPSNAAAVAWAKKLLPVVRAVVPATPVTISVSGEAGVAGLKKLKTLLAATPLDYYDYHFYGNSQNALALIRQAQAAVAPAPLVIGETGVSSRSASEGEQAAYLARVFQGAAAAGVRSVAPWTLNDFRTGAIPPSAVARSAPQYAYGLYRANGTAKPAAAVVKAAWTGKAYPVGALDLGFENPAGQTPWTTFMPELGAATKVRNVAHSGKWSVRLTRTGKNAAGSPSYRVAPLQPVRPGQTWCAEAWARGTAATGTTQVALSWFDVNNRWLGGAGSATLPTGTTGWTRLTVAAKAPAGAAGLQLHLKSGANKGSVWFDDVKLSASLSS